MRIQQLLIAMFWLGLSACGYHLRDEVNLLAGMKNVYVEGASMPLLNQFKKNLGDTLAKADLTAPRAGITIRIFTEQSNQRVLSLSARGRSNELELYYRFDYEVIRPDGSLLAERQNLEIKREYFNNQQDIIAKANEETVIRNEMYQQAVRSVLDRTRVLVAHFSN